MTTKQKRGFLKRTLVGILLGVSVLTVAASTPDESEIRQRLAAADSLHSVGRTDSAAVVGEQTIQMVDKLNSPVLKVAANSAQGVYLRSLGKTEEALRKYNKGLEIITSGAFRENPDQDAIEEIASLYINLAVLNLDMQNKDEAVKNAVFSGKWISKSQDPSLKSMIYGVAGSVLTGAGDYKKALEYQSEAYENAQVAGSDEAAFRAAAYTMLLADRLGNPAESADWRIKCEALMPKIQSSLALLVYYQAECSIALKGKNPREAIKWFTKILALDGINNMPFVKFDCYNNMHVAYAELGEYKQAYNTLLESNVLRDSIWEQQKAESLRDLTVKYETKEMELALSQSEARRTKTLVWLLGALVVIALGGVGFLLYAGRQRRRRTEEYLHGLETERIRLGRELHDSVCNDLLAIQMRVNQGTHPKEIAGDVNKCREAVRRISYELMPPEFEYANLEEATAYFIGKQREAYKEKIEIDYSAVAEGGVWEDIPDSKALEIYRIIQEAVGNAVKHSGAGKIKVSLLLDGSEIVVSITDNGTFITGERKGIGIESIKRRAKAIGGDLELDPFNNGGTQIRLKVKID